MIVTRTDFDPSSVQGPLLRPAAAAAYIGVSMSSFYNLIEQGYLPRPLKLGPRTAAVPKRWLDQVIAARAAESQR